MHNAEHLLCPSTRSSLAQTEKPWPIGHTLRSFLPFKGPTSTLRHVGWDHYRRFCDAHHAAFGQGCGDDVGCGAVMQLLCSRTTIYTVDFEEKYDTALLQHPAGQSAALPSFQVVVLFCLFLHSRRSCALMRACASFPLVTCLLVWLDRLGFLATLPLTAPLSSQSQMSWSWDIVQGGGICKSNLIVWRLGD